MNNPTNQEIVMLQNIDRQFNQFPALQQICKTIGSKYQNPRLSQFLTELFPSLYGQQPETIHRAIKILLELVEKEDDHTDLQKELLTYTQYEYTDVLCAFFEKSLTVSLEEGQKHKSYIYNKRILSEAWERDPNPLVNKIKEKLDQANRESENWQDFEENLVSSLDESEQVYFSNITTFFQNKPLPKRQQSLYDKMRALMPDRLQQKLECGQQELSRLRINMREQKEPTENINRIHALDFYLKLYDLMYASYLTIQSEKIKKSELMKLLQELQNEIMKKEADLIQMKYVKYFYKNLKFKRLNGERRVSFDNHMSIRAKLTEFIKDDLINAQWPRKCKPPIIGKNWKLTYEELYKEFSKLNAEDAEQYFNIIRCVQNTIVQYLRFRWNYLYLFYNLIVETTYNQQQLDLYIDQAFAQMWKTKKQDIKLTYSEIVRKLGINQIQNQTLEYSGSMYLENQFLYIHNKIIRMYLKIYRYDGHNISLHQDIVKFEVNLIVIFNDNLKKEKEQVTRVLDNILLGDKEDKETKMEFYLSYFNSFTTKLSQIYVPNVSQYKKRNYALSPISLKEDYTKKICPYQEVLAREENQMDRVRFIIRYKLQFLRIQDAQAIEVLLNAFVEYFLNDNVFIFYLPTLYKSLFYFSKQKRALAEMFAEIEKIRFLSVAYKNDEVEPFILSNFRQERQKNEIAEADPQRYTFEKIYNYSQKLYNYYVQYYQQGEQWNDPLPRSNSLQELNTFHYNLMCFIPQRIFFQIKSEKQFYDELPKLHELIKVKQQVESFHTQDQFILTVNEFKQYKSQLIKEAANNEKYKEKLIDCFQKQYNKGRLIQEVIIFKSDNKIQLNEFELLQQTKRFWNSQIQQEFKQSQDQKGKLEELQKRISSIQSISMLKQDLVRIRDGISEADSFTQNFIKKNFDIYINYIDPPTNRTRHTRGHILNQNIINKKIQTLRETKYKELQQEDAQIISFISEQFENFMKGIIGKVLQATLVQKVGNEIKMYQNKTLTQDQQQKCKQLIEMQKLYGPQKDTNLDIVLYNPPQQQSYFNYELCDFTPTQRLPEFRRLMVETEVKSDELLQNKIRQGKWREEHPELNDILSKKVKRGTELWSYVSEFLSNRKKKSINQEDDDAEQDKSKQQIDQVDLKQLKQELYQKLKESEKQQQQTSSRLQYTKLLNLEKDNHLQTKKDVTTKTVQFVLENMPYYKKSHILYKSYIL